VKKTTGRSRRVGAIAMRVPATAVRRALTPAGRQPKRQTKCRIISRIRLSSAPFAALPARTPAAC